MSYISSPFFSGYFGDGVSGTICLDWPQIMILPILASQVARITGVSHCFYKFLSSFHSLSLPSNYILNLLFEYTLQVEYLFSAMLGTRSV
jgi:hypothetical protein